MAPFSRCGPPAGAERPDGGGLRPGYQREKEDFIQQRKSVSYWADAWRRLRKNVVAMVALGVIVLLVLFAFVGPMLVPYGYDQFNAGAENLYPWHYSLEAQQAY